MADGRGSSPDAAGAGGDGLDSATAALVELSASLSAGGETRLTAAMDAAAEQADATAAEEVLLQSYLFLGYPAALNAIAAWRRRTDRPPPEPEADRPEAWAKRGAEVCSAVYGGQYERLRENVAALHPDLGRWMVSEGYGKVLARPGLALEVRELCIAALLAGLDAPRQLYAHLRGALQVGAAPAEVDAAVELACRGLGVERAEAARAVWAEVQGRCG